MNNLEQRAADVVSRTKSGVCLTCRGRFLSNIYNPCKPYAELMHNYSLHVERDIKAMQREWQHHLDWIDQNEIGRPKATAHYTVEQLESMGMIGIYAKEVASHEN